MIRPRSAGGVAVLAAALSLTACASAFEGYDLAPNGLPVQEDALRRELAFEAADAYASVIEGERDLPEDDLLRLLYAGIAGRYAGAYEESSRLLDLASYLAEDRVTRSVSRGALSLITNDRALAYIPGRTERLMIPYVSALNYLDAGDPGGAAVEARRIEALLDRYDEDTAPDEIPESSRFFHRFAGIVFELAGDRNAADVAYRRARAGDAGGAVEVAGNGDPATATAEDSIGEVVILVERGFVPHRVEQSVVVLLPPAQARKLRDGSIGDKVAAGAAAATRILAAAHLLYGDRSGYYRDRGYRRTVRLEPWRGDSCDDCEDVDSYLLRVSWPVLYQEPVPAHPVRVRAGELGVDAMARLDVADGYRRDFEGQRAAILARTVVRAASKIALAEAAEDAVSKEDETAGRVVGVLAEVGALLTERADTRSWHLLPASVSIVRLRLPAGSHELTLALDGADRRGVSLGPVEVRPGRTAFVTHRLWR
jgi:hypothetical protein